MSKYWTLRYVATDPGTTKRDGHNRPVVYLSERAAMRALADVRKAWPEAGIKEHNQLQEAING